MAGGKIVEISTPKELKLKYSTRELDAEYMMMINSKIHLSLDGLGNNNEFMDIIKRGRYSPFIAGKALWMIFL